MSAEEATQAKEVEHLAPLCREGARRDFGGQGRQGGDGEPPPPRYSDFEVDLIAARYASSPPPPPYPSAADASAFDSHVGAFDSHVGAFDSHVGAFDLYVGAGRYAGGESGHLPVWVGVRHFPCVFIGNAAVFTVVYGRMAAC